MRGMHLAGLWMGQQRARKLLLKIGLLATIVWSLSTNKCIWRSGHWQYQETGVATILSSLNTTNIPPHSLFVNDAGSGNPRPSVTDRIDGRQFAARM